MQGSSSRHNSKEGGGGGGREMSSRPQRGNSSSSSAWTGVLNVVLIEGNDLLAMDFEGTSDPYCKFRSVRIGGRIKGKTIIKKS